MCALWLLLTLIRSALRTCRTGMARCTLACSRPPQRRCSAATVRYAPALQRRAHGTHHAVIFWICRLRVRCLGAAAAAAEEPLDASFEGPSPNTLTLPPSLVAGRGKGGGRGGGGEAVEAGTSPTSPITPPPAPPSTYLATPPTSPITLPVDGRGRIGGKGGKGAAPLSPTPARPVPVAGARTRSVG